MSRFEQDYAIVEYDKRTDAVVGRLLKFAEGEPFHEYMEALIEATKDTGSNKMLADTSQFDSAVTQEDQAWSVKDWAPRAEDAGVGYMALVMPESVVAQMSVDSIVEMAEDSIERSLFDDVDEAKDWLNRQ
jgi:hypothetical protein